jgi:hypothetical protein
MGIVRKSAISRTHAGSNYNCLIGLCARFGDQAMRLYDGLKRIDRERSSHGFCRSHAMCYAKSIIS